MNKTQSIETKYKKWIIAVSFVIPLTIAALFGIRIQGVGPFHILPPIYASINGITAITLLIAYWAIKNKKIYLHEKLMKVSIGLSLCFLLMYLAYHMTSDPTTYGGDWKLIYYFILISHIGLSIVIIPFVLFTYVKAIAKNFESHKKIAKIAFPLWLYVAITGVVVYLMISPFYA